MFSPDQGYTPFRRDRVGQNSGGVFIAVRNDIVVQEMTDIQSDCEYVWIKIDSFDSKLLLIGAYCKPHEHDQHSREEFSKKHLHRVCFFICIQPFCVLLYSRTVHSCLYIVSVRCHVLCSLWTTLAVFTCYDVGTI